MSQAANERGVSLLVNIAYKVNRTKVHGLIKYLDELEVAEKETWTALAVAIAGCNFATRAELSAHILKVYKEMGLGKALKEAGYSDDQCAQILTLLGIELDILPWDQWNKVFSVVFLQRLINLLTGKAGDLPAYRSQMQTTRKGA